ncbi:MAG: WS/DGAT/MGAT family O-acyltransferase [Blastococcus sp.]
MEQLSGVDTSFLSMETPTIYGHVGDVAVFADPEDGPPLTLAVLRRHVEQCAVGLPVMCRRLVEVPFGLDRPYWIIDPHFDVGAHLHEVALPVPGDDRQLQAAVERIVTRHLDRTRPLWELHLLTGLADRRTALVLKYHHAAVDGLGGQEIMTALLDTSPEPPQAPPPDRPEPEPVPSDAELLARTLGSLITSPTRFLELQRRWWGNLPQALRFARRHPETVDPARWLNLPAGHHDAGVLAPPPALAPRVSFNRPVGATRRWAFRTAPLAEAKALKKAAGVTVNDVVMAMCAGGLRRWLQERSELPDRPLVAAVPISLRTTADPAAVGNRVSSLLTPLPTDEGDPAERLRRVHEAMWVAKEEHAAISADVLADFTQFAMPAMAARAVRAALTLRLADHVTFPFNLVISNVPGPQHPLYLAGKRLLHLFPVSTICDGLGLNITVQSYLGNLDFGLIADPHLVHDLDTLLDHLVDELDILRAAHPAA